MLLTIPASAEFVEVAASGRLHKEISRQVLMIMNIAFQQLTHKLLCQSKNVTLPCDKLLTLQNSIAALGQMNKT